MNEDELMALVLTVPQLQTDIRLLTARMSNMQDEIAELRTAATAAPRLKPTGDMPKVEDIDKVWCQIWHTPDLPEGNKNKTVWSLSFEVFRDQQRQKYDSHDVPAKEVPQKIPSPAHVRLYQSDDQPGPQR